MLKLDDYACFVNKRPWIKFGCAIYSKRAFGIGASGLYYRWQRRKFFAQGSISWSTLMIEQNISEDTF
jgi:hypothetical protein